MNQKISYRWSRRLLLLLVLAIMCCLAACGERQVSLDTKINLDGEQSGSREMILSLDAGNFANVLGFSEEDLEKVLKASCPKELEWSSETKDGIYYCTFTLNFKNLKDYKSKVKKIAGHKVDIKLVSSSRLFSTGISYSENFSSKELFNWMIEALQDTGYLTADQSELFTAGRTELNYNDQVFTCAGDQANFDSLEERSAKRIDICTTYHENNLCDRDVIICFDRDTMSEMGQVIKDKLARRCPEGAESFWDEDGGNFFCTIRGENMTVQMLDEYVRYIFSGSESFVHGEGVRRPSTFKAEQDWNETLDVSLYTTESYKNFIMGYYVKWDKGVSLSIFNQNEGNEITLKESERYPKYQTVWERKAVSKSLKTQFHTIYGVKQIQVKDLFKKKNQLHREILIIMDAKLDQADFNEILESVQDQAKEQAQVTSFETEKGSPGIRITINQGIHAANQAYEALFGVEGQTNLERESKLLELKHPGKLKVILDFTKFIANEPKQTTLDYTAQFGLLETIVPDSVVSGIKTKNGNESVEKHTYHATTKGAWIDVTMDTVTFNLDALTLILIVLCIILIIVSIRLLPPILSKIWKQMRRGKEKFDQTYEGHGEEEETRVNQQYENEKRRASRDKALRDRWRNTEQAGTKKDDSESGANLLGLKGNSRYADADQELLVPDENEIILSEEDEI